MDTLCPRSTKARRRKRRSQSDLLISILKNTPSKNPASINQIARKSRTTWRTAKKNVDLLAKAGIVTRVKERGKRRAKYKK